jgi:alpha-L-fucosidase
MKRFAAAVILFMAASAAPAAGQSEDQRYVPETDPLVLRNLQRWQDLKFGLLMHWGPYSQWGVVESWSICAEDEGWCRRTLDDYQEYKRRYEGLKTTFNPVGFDPARWAAAARDAGMKYVVFTTKHHDGFTMFDSKLTDYRITSPTCPFSSNPKANVTREIFDAFRAQGFMVGAYFSKPDWHSPDYWWPSFATPDRNVNYDPAAYPDRWQRFVDFTHGQVMELMKDYGRVDILWLDGGWVRRRSPAEIKDDYSEAISKTGSGFLKSRIVHQDIRMDELVTKARAAQPGLIVVDRAVPGRNQNYLTPENQVPKGFLPDPWESCIISGGGWSFTPDAKYLTVRKAVHLLADIVAKGGNMLLNVAPGPDGRWQQGAYDLLAGIGSWMRVNGEAIYGAQPLPPYTLGRVRLTRGKDGSAYFIYLADDGETTLPAEVQVDWYELPPGAVLRLLGRQEPLKWRAFRRGFAVTIPANARVPSPAGAWTIRMSIE